MDPIEVKKKRGRKPKNFYITDEVHIVEKKKRGRKKKYEIENFDKIVNRNEINNFNHHIVYSDDEELPQPEQPSNVKQVSFGNLNITVSKKTEETSDDVSNFKSTMRNHVINENEYASDEEKEIPIENILSLNQENFEKYYKGSKKYIPDCTETVKDQSVKRLRVVSCLKNVISDDEWPDKTNVCCWWCCNKFDTTPCTLPTRYDSLRKRFTFMGIFCSWNCTKSYNFDMVDHKKTERSMLITFLVQQMYGIYDAINIKPSPPRQCLKMFGGYMTIDEFRNNASLVDSYHLNLVKRNYIHPEVTEVTNVKFKNEKKNLRISRNF